MSEASPFRHPFIWLRNKFLAGLALAVPIVVTFWILRFVYDFLRGMSEPLLRSFAGVYNQAVTEPLRIDMEGPVFQFVASFVGFLIPILFLIALGLMATNVIGVRVVSAMDKLLLRVPIISFIYKSLKQVIEAFRGFGDTRNFKRVVYIEYPSTGMKLVGFVTGQFYDQKADQHMTLVFIPGALSPMTGLLVVAETSRLVDAPLSLEEAMKIIFSGGLIGPDSADAPAPPAMPRKYFKRRRAQNPELDFDHLPKAEDILPDPPEPGADSEPGVSPSAKSSFIPWLKK